MTECLAKRRQQENHKSWWSLPTIKNMALESDRVHLQQWFELVKPLINYCLSSINFLVLEGLTNLFLDEPWLPEPNCFTPSSWVEVNALAIHILQTVKLLQTYAGLKAVTTSDLPRLRSSYALFPCTHKECILCSYMYIYKQSHSSSRQHSSLNGGIRKSIIPR